MAISPSCAPCQDERNRNDINAEQPDNSHYSSALIPPSRPLPVREMGKAIASPRRRSVKARLLKMPNPAHLYKSTSSSSRVNVHLTTSISSSAVPFERVVSSRSVVDSRERMDVDKVPEKETTVSNSPSDGE